jgi:hypothetical protein
MARNIERNRWHLQVSPSRDRPRGKPAERPGMVTCGRHLPGPFAGARPAAIPGGHEQMNTNGPTGLPTCRVRCCLQAYMSFASFSASAKIMDGRTRGQA